MLPTTMSVSGDAVKEIVDVPSATPFSVPVTDFCPAANIRVPAVSDTNSGLELVSVSVMSAVGAKGVEMVN